MSLLPSVPKYSSITTSLLKIAIHLLPKVNFYLWPNLFQCIVDDKDNVIFLIHNPLDRKFRPWLISLIYSAIIGISPVIFKGLSGILQIKLVAKLGFVQLFILYNSGAAISILVFTYMLLITKPVRFVIKMANEVVVWEKLCEFVAKLY